MVSFFERRANQCAWPLWGRGDEPKMVCGETLADLSKPYCTSCCKLAYIPKRKRNRAPDPNHEPRKFSRLELIRMQVAA